MTLEIFNWNKDAVNNKFDPPDGAPENQTILRQLNDVHREQQAVHRRNFSDVSGELVTAGASNAYKIVPSRRGMTAYFAGLTFILRWNHSNTGSSTLEIDYTGLGGLGPKPIVKVGGSATAQGDIVAAQYGIVTYNATSDSFMLLSAHTVAGPPNTILAYDANGQPEFISRSQTVEHVKVGQIAILVSDVDPVVFFGYGTWHRRATAKAIIGSGSYTDGNGDTLTVATGDVVGEYEHTLTEAEMQHNHNVTKRIVESGGPDNMVQDVGVIGSPSNVSHNNIPVSIAFNIWERLT